jgi:hypothetical protein
MAGALVVEAGVASAGGRNANRTKDPTGDVVDCANGTPADHEAPDIENVRVKKNGIVEVQMRRSVEMSLEDQFSFAVVVTITYPDGRVRTFLVEVHAEEVVIAEVDPTTGEPLSEGAPITIKGKKIRIETSGSVPLGTQVTAQGFNTPTETDSKSCDDATVEVTKEVKFARSYQPPDPVPPQLGSVDDLEEILL